MKSYSLISLINQIRILHPLHILQLRRNQSPALRHNLKLRYQTSLPSPLLKKKISKNHKLTYLNTFRFLEKDLLFPKKFE